MISKSFKEYINEKSNWETNLDILKKSKVIVDSYEPLMPEILRTLNNNDIEYTSWKDIDIIIYYLENYYGQ